MDFWDLTVILFRRWKVSLPLFLVVIGGTVFVALTAKPNYTMTSYVQLIPAKVSPSDNAMNASLRNPWNQLGIFTLGQAAVYSTQDQQFVDSLKADGHTDNFTLTMTQPNPIVTVEVVGATPADARDTTDLVVSRIRGIVQSLQTDAGVRSSDLIFTQRLDRGQNLEVAGGKVKRAVAAVAVAGLLLVVGCALGFDAFAKRRSRRRQERAETDSSLPGAPSAAETNGKEPTPSRKRDQASNRPVTAVPATDKAAPLAPASRLAAREQRTAIIVQRSASMVRRSSGGNKQSRPRQANTYMSMNAQGEVAGDDAGAAPPAINGDAGAIPSDVRTVLKPQRMGGDDDGSPQ